MVALKKQLPCGNLFFISHMLSMTTVLTILLLQRIFDTVTMISERGRNIRKQVKPLASSLCD